MPEPEDHARIPDAVPPSPCSSFDYDDISRGERIGTGGDADVFRASVDRDGGQQTVAVKEPRFQQTVQRATVERFEREADTWTRLHDHDNVVTVHEWGTDPLPWLALEHMDGGSLADRIGSADVAEALWLAGRVAEGIRHGHRHGVAHLDVKPTNVLLRATGDGTWNYPKVSDWGVAKLLLEHSNSVDGISPRYAAPEQFDPEAFGRPDDVTDVYQFGALLYALLAGEPPFTGQSATVMRRVLTDTPQPPSAHDPAVPAAVDDLVLKALEKEKADRYQGLLPMRHELDELFEAHVDGGTQGSAPVDSTTDGTGTATARPRSESAAATRPREIAENARRPEQETEDARKPEQETGESATATRSSGRWPTPYANLARTGYAPDVVGPTDGVGIAWRFDPETTRLRTAPVADDERVYVATSSLAEANYLYAVDRESGDVRWTFEVGHASESSPAVADGTVYLGDEANNVWAIDAETGVEQWGFDAPNRINGSSPAVVGETLYVVSGFSPDETGRLHALDRSRGTERWHVDLGNASQSPPAVADDTVYVGDEDGTLSAISVSDRAIAWQFETESRVHGIDDPPAVANGRVYVNGRDGNGDSLLFALDADTGAELWRSDRALSGNPTVVDGTVYACGAYSGEGLVALDAATGREQWESDPGPGLVSVAAGETIYAGGLNGVYSIDANSGAMHWQFDGGSTDSPPAVVDGEVYAVNGTTLYAIAEE